MSGGLRKESHIPGLSHIGSERGCLCSVVDSACGCRQSGLGSICTAQ